MLWGSETYGMLEEYPLIQAVLILGLASWSDLDLGSSSICPTHWWGSVLEQSSLPNHRDSFINQQGPLKIGRDCPNKRNIHPWKFMVWKMYLSPFKHGYFWYLCEIAGAYPPWNDRSFQKLHFQEAICLVSGCFLLESGVKFVSKNPNPNPRCWSSDFWTINSMFVNSQEPTTVTYCLYRRNPKQPPFGCIIKPCESWEPETST